MAGEGEQVEYESDPEDALLPSARRRREASDDEEGEGSDGGGRPVRADPRVGIESDGESDDQGVAPAYEDDEDLEAEEEGEELYEEVEEEFEKEVELGERASEGGPGAIACEESEIAAVAPSEGPEDGQRSDGDLVGYQGKNQVGEEEKKESEPFVVPKAGAFYMHDDRFRENGGGRHRRMPDVRKLWESKDDRAWVHDRFEEMNLQDVDYGEERRNPKGRFRGRGNGKTRDTDRGNVRANRYRVYDDSNFQNHAPKAVKGRGPRRYEPPARNNRESPATQNNRSVKPHELTSSTSTGRRSLHIANVQPDSGFPQRHGFASSLSSASLPFYPSGSSNQDISVPQRRDARLGTTKKTLSSSMQMEDNFSTSQNGSLLRGKAIIDSVGHDRVYTDDSIRPVAGKIMGSTQVQPVGSSLSPINATQYPQSRVQGKGSIITGLHNYQPTSSVNQAIRISAQTKPPVVQQRADQTQAQAALRFSTQQLGGQRPGSGTQAPTQALLTSSSEVAETESPPGSSNSKTPLVGKGKTSNQVTGRGSFLFSGAQVIGASGAMGLAHAMQFGGQHHGVPAVGLALPGYVAQPQPGFGNSEMTWLPVLAGAAGSLEASYCSPYIALDGGYYARPSGQPSSSVYSRARESILTKPANTGNPPQRPEIVNDELGQRQNKPRRYSEMNFGQ